MINLDIYCMTVEYFKILDKLPPYIKPLGLGNNIFPKHWLIEKNGENISNFNKHYGEASGFYWIWKNRLINKNENDWIGSCQHRRLWLNNLYDQKQKFSVNSLYSKLLNSDNQIFSNCDTVLLQPTVLKNESVLQQFNKVYGKNIIENSINFLEKKDSERFKNYLNGNQFSICNMFITKVHHFKSYCEILFPWLDKCLNYCVKNNLCKNENVRLPIFLAERFTSYWFTENTNAKYLSFARLGKFLLSNKVNKFINPAKIPFTFRMYPTIHDY